MVPTVVQAKRGKVEEARQAASGHEMGEIELLPDRGESGLVHLAD